MISRYRLPLLAGVLIGTSYIPFPPLTLFFCLVPLWIFSLRARSLREAFVGGWIAQFMLNLIGFHWVARTAIEIGHFGWFGAGLSLFVFCSVAHLYFPFSLAVWFLIKRRTGMGEKTSLFFLATALAFFNGIFPSLFPWHFGYPWLFANLPAIHVADWIGFEGLSFVALSLNAVLAIGWLERRRRKVAFGFAAVAILVFVGINLIGQFKAHDFDETDRTIRMLAVQGNIGNFEKLEAEKGEAFRPAIVARYMDLTRRGLVKHPNADIVIWPETAFPNYLDPDLQSDASVVQLGSFVRSTERPLLTGSFSRDARTRVAYNALAILNGDGSLRADPPYRKTILMAFGEYIPGADYFPLLSRIVPSIGLVGSGSGPLPFRQGSWVLGPQICYEGLFPWFSNGLVQNGTEVFVNLTNDSFFGSTFEPYQHFYMTLARAIEFRRPLVRVTNTGFTSAILASGKILETSPRNQEWFGEFEVPYKSNPLRTIYSYVQPFWFTFLFVILMGLIVVGRISARRDGRFDSLASADIERA